MWYDKKNVHDKKLYMIFSWLSDDDDAADDDVKAHPLITIITISSIWPDYRTPVACTCRTGRG